MVALDLSQFPRGGVHLTSQGPWGSPGSVWRQREGKCGPGPGLWGPWEGRARWGKQAEGHWFEPSQQALG